MTNLVDNVTAIIVTYNSSHIIENTIKNLSYLDNIIIIDNNSQDETVKIIQQYPKINLICLEKNIGFGKANNIGLNLTKTNYGLLINPDAEIDQMNLTKLLEKAKIYNDASILAPRFISEGKLRKNSFRNSKLNKSKTKVTYIEPSGDLCADFVSGALWLVNMELLNKVGFYDENLFMYFEDDDLCIRIRKAGYSIIQVSDAFGDHIQNASSKPSIKTSFLKSLYFIESKYYFYRKYYGYDYFKNYKKKELCKALITILINIIMFRKKSFIKNLAVILYNLAPKHYSNL